MLSRTAEYLYWISRYMERAETTARLLDVGYRMSLFPNPRGYNNEWESVLAASGAIESYKKKYNDIIQKHVEDYLFFDEENPSSIYNCILNARNNALVVRTSFTPESWLAINKAYQEILKFKQNKYSTSDLPNLTEWAIEQVNLFRGTINSLLRNDGYKRLFRDTYEFFHPEGATPIIKNILGQVDIELKKQIDIDNIDDEFKNFDHLILTCPLDSFLKKDILKPCNCQYISFQIYT